MAKYTTEVRSICEHLAGYDASRGYQSVKDIISKSRSKVFDFDYPIFDSTYKSVLETKILKHYYGREIGAETFGRWQLWLDTRMNEIMPYYNKLYESELLEFNPLYDVDLTTDRTREGNESGTETGESETATSNTSNTTRTASTENDVSETATSSNQKAETGTITDEKTGTVTRTDNTTATSQDSGSDSRTNSKVDKNSRWDIFSDTPQGALQDITLNDGAYLTNARHIIDDGTGSTENGSTTYGKKNTTTNTGTVQTAESSENERTLNTSTTDTGSDTLTRDNDTTESESIGVTASGTSNTDTSKSHNIDSTEEYLEHVKGKTAGTSFSKMLAEYRETFLNIDMLVIGELSDLFMGLW